ncbi:MAG: polyprenyl synthetase family protein, partial [Anaerolineae bacterium]
ASCGANWTPALPAAAAIELLHNFSLVHDDVQDHSDKRRGRPTVWKKWGAPMAINAGDALFVLANQAMLDLKKSYPAEIILQTEEVFQNVCLDLTRGQFLDMYYEERNDLKLEDYWPMIAGKTAALLSACTQIGAILGGASESKQEVYRQFGWYLGLAFQVQDDILGIWGDESRTGKSTTSDLVEGKKSLPVLFGLNQQKKFAKRWQQGPIRPEEVESLAALLASEGGQKFAQAQAEELTQKALQALHEAAPAGKAGQMLHEIAYKLLGRAQ